MLVFVISRGIFLLPSWPAFWNKEAERWWTINMIHSHSACVWICCCLGFDLGNQFPYVHGAVIKNFSVWFQLQDRALCGCDCSGLVTIEPRCENNSMFDKLWAISEHSVTHRAAAGPLRQEEWFGHLSSHKEGRELRYGYSPLLFPIESWETPKEIMWY